MCYHDDDRFVANVFGSGGVSERVESLGQIGSRRGHARHLYDNQFRYNFLYKIINSDWLITINVTPFPARLSDKSWVNLESR
jgi:hypothetical protein